MVSQADTYKMLLHKVVESQATRVLSAVSLPRLVSTLAKLQTELMQQQSRLFFLVHTDRRATAHAKAVH